MSTAGIPLVIYSGNDDSVVNHFASEVVIQVRACIFAVASVLRDLKIGIAEHNLRWHPRFHEEAADAIHG